MTVYLHIGTGKTGTSSIQAFLQVNAEALAERHNLLTPKTLSPRNHRKLTVYALNDDVVDSLRRGKKMTSPESINNFRERLRVSFAQEAATWKPDQTIVMTSEQMTRLRSPEEVQRLKDLVAMSGHDIKVIVYFRRQDLYYVSAYSQNIKSGHALSFCAEGPLKMNPVYYFDRFLAPWEEVFGREAITARAYERSALLKGDVVDDFMALVGINDLSGLERPPLRNESLDAHTMEYLRRLNAYVPRYLGADENLSRPDLLRAMEKLSTGPKIRMEKPQAEAYLEQFREGHEHVARTYLGREDGVLFNEKVNDHDGIVPSLPEDICRNITAQLFNEVILPHLNEDEMIAVMGAVWNSFSEQKKYQKPNR